MFALISELGLLHSEEFLRLLDCSLCKDNAWMLVDIRIFESEEHDILAVLFGILSSSTSSASLPETLSGDDDSDSL